MSEWSYERQKRFDQKGRRWHFVMRHVLSGARPYEEEPYELYYRDDERTEYGMLRFEHRKDNPYRNYEVVVNKIMNDPAFRESLRDEGTKAVWAKNWK